METDQRDFKFYYEQLHSQYNLVQLHIIYNMMTLHLWFWFLIATVITINTHRAFKVSPNQK